MTSVSVPYIISSKLTLPLMPNDLRMRPYALANMNPGINQPSENNRSVLSQHFAIVLPPTAIPLMISWTYIIGIARKLRSKTKQSNISILSYSQYASELAKLTIQQL